jgi:hypothetical protein
VETPNPLLKTAASWIKKHMEKANS